MSYKSDLEEHIRSSYSLIHQYEEIVRLSSDPKEQVRARHAIEEQWGLIKGYLDKYIPLCKHFSVNISEDLIEIAVHFPEYKSLFPQSTEPIDLVATTLPSIVSPTLQSKFILQEKPMSSIPSELYNQLRQVLLDCGSFDNDNQLRAVFAHAKLSPWRHAIPQASTPADRVAATIAFLAGKYRADTKENALVLLLSVLSELIDPGDECHFRLATLAKTLERQMRKDSSTEDRRYLELLNLIEERCQRWRSLNYSVRGKTLIEYDQFLEINKYRPRFTEVSQEIRAYLLRCAVQNGMGGEWGKWLMMNKSNEQIVPPLVVALDSTNHWEPAWRAAYILEKTFGQDIFAAIGKLDPELTREDDTSDVLQIIGNLSVKAHLEQVTKRKKDKQLMDKARKVLEEVKMFAKDIDEYTREQSVKQIWLSR